MSDDLQVVLGAIEGLRSDVREDQKQIWRQVDKNKDCTNQTKLKVEKLNGKHEVLKTEIKHIKLSSNKMDEHVDNPEIHFDKDKAATTSLGYLAKKKILIIFLTALGVIVSGITTAWLNGSIGG